MDSSTLHTWTETLWYRWWHKWSERLQVKFASFCPRLQRPVPLFKFHDIYFLYYSTQIKNTMIKLQVSIIRTLPCPEHNSFQKGHFFNPFAPGIFAEEWTHNTFCKQSRPLLGVMVLEFFYSFYPPVGGHLRHVLQDTMKLHIVNLCILFNDYSPT